MRNGDAEEIQAIQTYTEKTEVTGKHCAIKSTSGRPWLAMMFSKFVRYNCQL